MVCWLLNSHTEYCPKALLGENIDENIGLSAALLTPIENCFGPNRRLAELGNFYAFANFKIKNGYFSLAFRSISTVQYFQFRIYIFVLQQNDRYDKSDTSKRTLIKKQFYEIHIF